MCFEMVDVGSERSSFESEHDFSYLLVILQVQGVSDVFAYRTLESLEDSKVPTVKVISVFPRVSQLLCLLPLRVGVRLLVELETRG